MKELDLMTFPELADRVVKPTLRCFVRMVWPIAVPMVALSVFLLGVQSTWLRGLQSGKLDAEFGAGLVSMLAALLFAMVWSLLCVWAVSIAAVDLLAGRPTSFWRSLRQVFRPQVFLTMLLSTVITVASVLLCVVPVLFVMPLLFVLVPVMVHEELYGMDAIRRSVELVRFNATGRWSDSGFIQAFGLIFIGYGISSAISMVVQLPFMIYQQYYIWNETLSGRQVDPFSVTQELSWLQLPVQMVNVFAQLLGWFYWAIAAVVLYLEIRRRRDGRDLEVAIARNLKRVDGG